jgi:hypothetical protein
VKIIVYFVTGWLNVVNSKSRYNQLNSIIRVGDKVKIISWNKLEKDGIFTQNRNELMGRTLIVKKIIGNQCTFENAWPYISLNNLIKIN